MAGLSLGFSEPLDVYSDALNAGFLALNSNNRIRRQQRELKILTEKFRMAWHRGALEIDGRLAVF
ncbi:MAG: hypothetical protein BGN84_10270 [Afipia sp. 62-7]|nr:MAG: hypothetical protein BGN84_10270 [Afipia sp. 62-7]